MTEKPPFSLPTMADVAAARGTNGMKVASTFSGCGGSCLGFELAGFEVVYASEFVAAARDTYRANHPGVHVDERDVRDVQPQDILDVAGLAVGELDVLEGSPPCASFSTSGKRHQHWGKTKKYSATAQRTDDLFFEYARLLEGVQPRAFVAENVAGLVKGVAKGYFQEILARLRGCGYRVSAKVLDAQWLGVPQTRNRVIFIGVRNDLERDPAFPAPLPYRYSLRDALGVDGQLSCVGLGSYEDRGGAVPTREFADGQNHGLAGSEYAIRVRQREGSGGKFVDGDVDEPAPAIMAHGLGGSSRTQYELRVSSARSEVPADGEIFDPETGERIDLGTTAIAKEYDRLKPGESSEKFFNLVRVGTDGPSPTVTQAGGSHRGTASVAHPTERRKFTLAECRRICSFPADFTLTGTYAERWERLGRAVPPMMMFHVARTIREQVFDVHCPDQSWAHVGG